MAKHWRIWQNGHVPTETEQVLSRLGVKLTASQRKAVAYLERRGLRFGVEFGYKNVMEVARIKRREKRRANARKVAA
jgi:hypothetical protein